MLDLRVSAALSVLMYPSSGGGGGYGEGGGRGRRECNKRFEQAIESEYQIHSCDCFGFVMGLPNFLIRSRGENEASARLGKETATLAQYFKRFPEKVRLRSVLRSGTRQALARP